MRRNSIQTTAVRSSVGQCSMFCRNIRVRSRGRACEPTCTSSPCPTLGLLVAELLSQGAERDTRRPLSASRERTPLNWTPTHLRPRLNFCCEESGIQVVVENHGLRGSPAGRPSGSWDGLCPARPISFSHPWPERALKRAYSCEKNY